MNPYTILSIAAAVVQALPIYKCYNKGSTFDILHSQGRRNMLGRFYQYVDSGRTSEDAPYPVMEFEPHEGDGRFLPLLQIPAGRSATFAWIAFIGGLVHETMISTITQLRAKERSLEGFENGHDLFTALEKQSDESDKRQMTSTRVR